jgi:iron-sulfur cluster assembly protein
VAPTLVLTDNATEKVRQLLQEQGCGALRVFVAGGGCAGYQYAMTLAQEADEEDFVIDHQGVRVVVDPESAPLLEGAEIDYVVGVMKSGFSISNPNAVQSCACGSSFDTAGGGGQPRPCR